VADSGRNVRQVQNHPTYAAMIESLDESVGRILDKLEELHLTTNTIVIFTSDNGGLSTAEGSPTSNVPLRAGKGWSYEGGVRVPLLIAWPSQIAAARVSPLPVTSTDLYPTLLELLNLPPRPEQTRDGRSVAPVLRGGNLTDRPLFWHYPHYSNQGGAPSGAIRMGRYKLVEWYEDMRVELFDLEQDPSERNDLAQAQPAVTARLRERLHDWRRESGAQMPTPNPDYRPAKAGQ
jgi:arylsulfatase A-like enzyme